MAPKKYLAIIEIGKANRIPVTNNLSNFYSGFIESRKYSTRSIIIVIK